jgi:hypothetical protein
MKNLKFIICIGFLGIFGCGSDNDATETNITRTPCLSNSQCIKSDTCVAPDANNDGIAETSSAYCVGLSDLGGIQNTSISLLCNSNADCIEGSSCLFYVDLREDGVKGFCRSNNPEECIKRCMNGADALTTECKVDSDCAPDEFCNSQGC